MSMTIRLSPRVEAIHNFYFAVDNRDIRAAMACFADDAIYRRPGFAELNGLHAIDAFYRQTRDVGEGRHTVEAAMESADEVAIRGRFEGFFLDGVELQIRFADFWKFANCKVVERNSYLFQNDGRRI